MEFNELKEKLLSTNCFEDNEYLNQYCKLICDNQDQEKIKNKTSSHHIIPRCYFDIIGDDIDDSKFNLVNLYHKDHLIAHYYLVLSCPRGILFDKLNYAFIKMSSHKVRLGLQDFDFNILEEYQNLYEEHCKEISKRNTGRKYSLESVQKISKANSGKVRSQDTKDLISLHSKGIKKPSTSIKLKGRPSKSKGKKKPEGFGEKVSKAKKGISFTPQHIKALTGISRPNNGRKKGVKNNPNIINKRKVVLSAADLNLLISSYNSGKSVKESGMVVNISEDVCYRILKENNVQLRKISETRKFLSNGHALTPDSTILKAFKLYFNGDLSQVEIHNITGIGLEVFRLKLIEYGIQLKNKRYFICNLLKDYKLYESEIQDLQLFVDTVKSLLQRYNI